MGEKRTHQVLVKGGRSRERGVVVGWEPRWWEKGAGSLTDLETGWSKGEGGVKGDPESPK